MHQTLKRRLKPILIIALVTLTIPAIAPRMRSDGSIRPNSSIATFALPGAATILDLKNSLLLTYKEQSLERRVATSGEAPEVSKAVQNSLRRAPAHAVAARVPQPVISGGTGGGSVSHSGHSGADWYAIAQCESGGQWNINSGNGFWGGLQFTPSTWFAYGGGPFDGVGPFPYSSSEQIAVGERVLAGQGPGAWPNCFVWA
jgi:hypothetical protein